MSDARSEQLPGLAVFGLSLGLLLYELSLTRLLSVVYYYHTAFLAISVAVLGLAAGAQWVALAPGRFAGRERLLAGTCALGMALLPPLFPFVRPPLAQLEHLLSSAFLLPFGLAVLACLVPFVAGGAVLALVFQGHRDRVARLYAADLLGAAAGTLLLVPVMEELGGPTTLFVCGAIAGLATPGFGSGRRRAIAWLPLGLLLGLAVAQRVAEPFPLRVDVDPGAGRAEARPEVLYEKWNAFSRVAALRHEGWDRGLSSTSYAWYEPDLPEQIDALIDINAFAPFVRFDGDLSKLEHLDEMVSNLAYHVLPRGRSVAILGPGGGKDVLGALRFDARRVLGIELNPIIADDLARGRLREFTGDVYGLPGVELVVGDARAGMERRDERFDLILANSVATWAAHGSGAMSLTEQHLFTREAFALWRDRLEPGGILSISLWDGTGYPLVLRLFETWRRVTGGEALERRVAAVANPWGAGSAFVTVLLARRPFDPAQAEHLHERALDLEFDALHVPGRVPLPDTDLAAYFAAPDAFVARASRDLAAATDDRPFFFFTRRLGDVLDRGASLGTENQALVSLLLSLALLLVLVCLLLLLPLVRAGRRTSRLRPREHLYFAGIGAGFLLVEVALIQRLTLLLGHPTQALTVVLFGLLLWTGLGSRLAAGRAPGRPALRALGRALGAVPLLLLGAWCLAPVLLRLPAVAALPPAKVLVALALLAPAGILMGFPFPVGLRHLDAREGAPLAHALGINGAFGVLASVGAIVLAVAFGFTATFGCGLAAYLLALVVRPRP